MCWVQPGGQDGPLFSYGDNGVLMQIVDGKFVNEIVKRSSQPLTSTQTAEILPAGKWVHVAASYDHNTGINSLYINGHFSISQNIGKDYQIATNSYTVRMGFKDCEETTYFKGKIAEIKVYDVALNKAQIQTSIMQGCILGDPVAVSRGGRKLIGQRNEASHVCYLAILGDPGAVSRGGKKLIGQLISRLISSHPD